MAAGFGLILAALLYVFAITILLKTSGFQRKNGKANSFLRFKDFAISFELGVIGLFNLMIGVIWLALWFLFLVMGWESFQTKIDFMLPHVLIQLITAIALLTSGIAAIREWSKWQLVYLISLAFVLLSTAVSLIVYDASAHGRLFTMRFLGVWSFFVCGVLTLGFFTFYRLLNSSGKPSKRSGHL